MTGIMRRGARRRQREFQKWYDALTPEAREAYDKAHKNDGKWAILVLVVCFSLYFMLLLWLGNHSKNTRIQDCYALGPVMHCEEVK